MPAVLGAAAAMAIVAWAATGLAARTTSSTEIPAGGRGSVKTHCPPRTRVVLGGVHGEDDPVAGGPLVHPTQAKRYSHRLWRAEGVNEGGESGDLEAIAYCGKAPKVTKVRQPATVASGEQLVARARCPRGTDVAFGGFSAPNRSPGSVVTDQMRRARGRRWAVEAVNNDLARPAEFGAIAYCADVERPAVRRSSESLAPGDVEGVKARCPRHTKLAFGGFTAEYSPRPTGGVTVSSFERASDRGWRVAGYGRSTSGDLKSIAYCR
jgi:hypothetical protein